MQEMLQGIRKGSIPERQMKRGTWQESMQKKQKGSVPKVLLKSKKELVKKYTTKVAWHQAKGIKESSMERVKTYARKVVKKYAKDFQEIQQGTRQ